MKINRLVIVIIITLSIFSAKAQTTQKIIKQSIPVADFTAISASSGWDLIISQGKQPSVTIEVSENFIDRAKIEVKKGVLRISLEKIDTKINWRIIEGNKKTLLRAYITVTDLKEIAASGGVDVSFETPFKSDVFKLNMNGGSDLNRLTLDCNSFMGNFSGGSDAKIQFSNAEAIKVDASGGSDVNLYNLNAQQCTVRAAGGSDIKLTGSVEAFDIEASGGSDVSADELNAKHCLAQFSGGSDAKIRVSNKLNIALSGTSDVVCYGNPSNVQKSVCMSCSLNFR